MTHWLGTIVDALLPAECEVCGRPLVEGEKVICLHCMIDFPKVEIKDFNDNILHEKLASAHPFERAASLLSYRKGSPYTSVILNAKYNNRPYIASWLGRQLADCFYPQGFFNGIDAIVPVPMNWLKVARRGYNQSLLIAKGLSRETGIPIMEFLRARHHSTQTRKNAIRRHENARGVYKVRKRGVPENISHIVLVDDVATTGATLLECAEALRSVRPTIKISAITAAMTEM